MFYAQSNSVVIIIRQRPTAERRKDGKTDRQTDTGKKEESRNKRGRERRRRCRRRGDEPDKAAALHPPQPSHTPTDQPAVPKVSHDDRTPPPTPRAARQQRPPLQRTREPISGEKGPFPQTAPRGEQRAAGSRARTSDDVSDPPNPAFVGKSGPLLWVLGDGR